MKALTRLIGSGLLALALLVAAFQADAQIPNNNHTPFKNIIIGGDFGTNPWQRGTSNVGGNIAATGTYTADRWAFVGGASSSINISKSTANVPTVAAGGIATGASLNFQRTAANANTTQICGVQIIESGSVIPISGQQVTASFWMAAGANFSGTSVIVNLITGTTADEGLTTFISGWTGASTIGTATIPFTSGNTAWARYFPGVAGGPFTGLTATVPNTAKEMALQFCWTPVGTAGTTDSILLADVQLEVGPSVTYFEKRSAGQELTLAQRYAVVFVDTGTAALFPAACQASTTTTLQCVIMLPQSMRVAPTATWSNTTSFGAVCTATNVAASAWAQTASGVQSVLNSITATATIGAVTAAAPCLMIAKNTAVTLIIGAEL